MKEISGERLYKNIQYFWMYRKGYPLSELKGYLGPRYAEYQSLPKIKLVPNRIVREYAFLLKTSVSRLRMQNKNRDSKVDAIKKTRAAKYHLSKSDGVNEKTTSFIAPLTSPKSNKMPKPDTTSRKWNDNDTKRLREFLESRRKSLEDNEYDRGAMK